MCVTDRVPPVISGCPSSFQQYSDQGLTYTHVSWTVPTATDNLDSVAVTLTTGSDPGSIFYESPVPYTIRYDARDNNNNLALPCIFSIVVSSTYHVYINLDVVPRDPVLFLVLGYEYDKSRPTKTTGVTTVNGRLKN